MPHTPDRIERIDRILESGHLDDDTVDTLVDLLTPDTSQPWPDIRVVLHAAQHPTVAPGLKRHAVPDRLERAICDALEAVLPLLGIHPYGPTYKLVEIADRELQKERRKHETVVDHLEGTTDEEAAVGVVDRYLETDPAPIFVNRLRQLHPDLLDRAGGGESPGLVEQLEDAASVVDSLRRPPESNEEAVAAIRNVLDGVEAPPLEALAEALTSENPDEQLLGAALMAWHDEREGVSSIIRRVVQGSEVAPQLAVFAGRLAPDRALSAFSQFVAEVSWQNPELPEAELTEPRVRAILSARAILPHLETDLPQIAPEQLPSTVPTDALREIPSFVDRYWAIWAELI